MVLVKMELDEDMANEEMIVEEGQKEILYVAVEPIPAATWYSIDVTMFSSKCSYFFQNAKDACYLPYMILFLTGIGLTPEEAGTINGLRFIAYIIGAPAWGILADHRRVHLLVVLVLCGFSFVLMISQPFSAIPFVRGVTDNDQAHDNASRGTANSSWNDSYLASTSSNRGANTSNVTTTAAPIRTKTPGSKLFAIMLMLNSAATSFDGSTQGFVDAGVMKKISSYTSRRIDFGTTRLFGSIGYGTGILTSSIAIEYLRLNSLPLFVQVFLVYGVFVLCLMASLYCLYRKLDFQPLIVLRDGKEANQTALDSAQDNDTKDEKNCTEGYEIQLSQSSDGKQICLDDSKDKEGVGKLLCKTLSKLSTSFFFATILFVGIVHAIYVSFLFVLLKQIQCPNVVMGLSICVASISSVVGIKFSENLIRQFGGTFQVLCLCTFSWSIRFLAYFYLMNPFLVLLIQLLQGLGYGLFITVAAIHIKSTCVSEIFASMFGILNGLFFGAGFVFGNVIGGSVLMRLGIRILCLGCSVASAVWTGIMLLYILYRLYFVKHHTSQSK